MDRVVHLAPGFGLGLSMSSSRVLTYESIHGENVNGWHTGEGMLYLYNPDLTQFDDDFWPTVDPHRLPGTTIDVSQIREPASGQGDSRPIETVVENRLLHGGGDKTLTVDGTRKTEALGGSEAMRDVTWAHLAG